MSKQRTTSVTKVTAQKNTDFQEIQGNESDAQLQQRDIKNQTPKPALL